MKIAIKTLESKLGYKIKRNFKSIGMDIAERTGICVITTDENEANFDFQFIEFDKSDIKKVYEEMFDEFMQLIEKDKDKGNVTIIEDSFLRRFGKFVQADVFKKLTRFGTLALAVCFLKGEPYHFILAKSARAKFKIKMEAGHPKESVANYLKETLQIELDDNDISDCYDKETELLTNQGWKYFKDLNGSEKCFSMNLESEIADYYPIQQLIKQKYKGKMYSYKSATCNFLVTPNHKLIIRTTDVPKYIKEGKKSVWKQKKNGQFTKDSHVYWNHGAWKWHFCEIKNLNTTYWWMPRTCTWIGKSDDDYIIPSYFRDYNIKTVVSNKFERTYKRKFKWNEMNLNMNDWLKFLGWYISEGNLQYNKSKKQINAVCISQLKDKKKIQEIKDLLKKLGFKFHYSSQKTFRINNSQLANYLSKLCYVNNEFNCYNKKVPEFIKSLSKEQIDIFLDAFNKGDGWIEKAGNRNYRTHSKQLANDLQELIVKIGKCGSLRTDQPNNKKRWYKDHFIQTKTVGYHLKEFKYTDVFIAKKDLKTVDYDDFIYCVQCEPHNTLLIRRNGQIFWSGNSIILACLGLCENMDFGPVTKKPSKKKQK
jgi:hypothetical protein